MKHLFGDILRHHPSCEAPPDWRRPPLGPGLEFWMTHRSDHPGCFKERACQKPLAADGEPPGAHLAAAPCNHPPKPRLLRKPGLWLVFSSFRVPVRLPPSKTTQKDETVSPPFREQTNPDSRIPRDVMGCTVKKRELRSKPALAGPGKICGSRVEQPGRSYGSGKNVISRAGTRCPRASPQHYPSSAPLRA